jgi:folate-dependent tRNA-U54 methylase TrmFO/GidA
MGFGGAALAANQVIRNNRNLLKNKRSIGNLSFVSSTNEKWVDPKKVTFDQLMEIRTRIRHENKVRLYKIILLTVLGFVALILLLALIPWDSILTNTFNPYSH